MKLIYMRKTFILIKNDKRYPGIELTLPSWILLDNVTFEQAQEIAERLSNHNVGCDYSWYIEGREEDY